MQTATKTPEYSRENPSPRYRELTALYQQMHAKGSQERVDFSQREKVMFPGYMLLENVPYIKAYIINTGARSILDYGCGKGLQYEVRNFDLGGAIIPSVQDFWGVKEIAKYDPAYGPYTKLPTSTYDGVVCTDVLEHCPEEDIRWILAELFGYANKFVYANVASYPAKKNLPNGENAHCTIQPPDWWKARIREAAATKPGVIYSFWIASQKDGGYVNEEFNG